MQHPSSALYLALLDFLSTVESDPYQAMAAVKVFGTMSSYDGDDS
jgi:hypothetical protein